ncbi:MAG: hypothetical protein HN498_00260, partial [Flavobacteriales bacterium]|nr:hypothetical protein [Flavobacteriales bacterium]
MKTNFNKKSPKKFLGYLMAAAMTVFSFNATAQCDTVTVSLYDSFGDGWNGGLLTIDGTDYTIATGSFAAFDLCIDLSICTDIIYTAGSWSTENSWDITDASGAVIASGPNASGQIGVCPVYGCTDSTAMNYDATATDDDGSCISSCTVAPYCENFDAGVPADWSNNGWTLDALGTGSSGTGPSDDITGGGNYMYYETSGSVASPITLTSLCLDVSALASPTLSFYNHMFGATMGTLDVLVNGTSVWSQSGDQGDQWNFTQVDLSAYAGNTNITIDFVGTIGTSFTGDMAIDEVCVDEYLVIDGCTDPIALNYDANANNDDGSCSYCTDNLVTITCGGGSFVSEVSWTLLNSSGTAVLTGGAGGFGAPYSSVECLPSDCYTVDMSDSFGDGWNGNIFDISMGGVSIGSATLATGSSGTADISVGATCPVLGCTDAAAVNYDAFANTDDGSCMYSCTAAPYCENFDLGVGTWTNN